MEVLETRELLDGVVQDSFGLFPQNPIYAEIWPASLAAADFNADGRTDLVTCDRINKVSVYLGLGHGLFKSPVAYQVGNRPVFVAVGDFNGDGSPDLVSANSDDDNISILLGTGDGTFQQHVTYEAQDGPASVAVGDLNGDGHLDIAAANGNSSNVSVFLGVGNGTFQPQVAYAVGDHPISIAAADFNGDGHLDLATANAYADSVSVLLGVGDGTFQPQVVYTVGDTPFSIAAADFNGDGHADLVTTNPGTDNVSVLLNAGDGTFQARVDYAVGDCPLSVAVGDFNADGHVDMVTANQYSYDAAVLLGVGDGTFHTPVTYHLDTMLTFAATSDLNNDGKLDLALVGSLVDGDGKAGGIWTLFGVGDGVFEPQVAYRVGNQPASVVARDFNADGHVDLATANRSDSTISVLMNQGNGLFQPQATYEGGRGCVAIAAGDFNGDAVTDLVTADASSVSVSVLLGAGDGTFPTHVAYDVGGVPPVSVAVGDFNGDEFLDVVAANSSSDNVAVLLGNGDGTLQAHVDYPVGDVPRFVTVGDFNGDGCLDLVTANQDSNDVSVLLGVGDGTFQAQVTYEVGQWPASVAVGDFNADGALDLAAANTYDHSVSVLLGRGNGTFHTQVVYQVGSTPNALAVGDFNSDGHLDVVAANCNSDSLSLLLGRGNGTFRTQVVYDVGNGPWSVTAEDLNNDGKTDLAVANWYSNSVSVLMNGQYQRLFVGTAENDLFRFQCKDEFWEVTLNGEQYTFGSAIPDVVFAGNGGSDRAVLFDSSESDTFEAWSDRAQMRYAAELNVTVNDCQYVDAYTASDGQVDTAVFHDSATSDDKVTITTAYCCQVWPGQCNARGFGFENVTAYGDSGGSDTAVVWTAEGDDHVAGNPNQWQLTVADPASGDVPLEYVELNGFDAVTIRAGEGTDTAQLSDAGAGATDSFVNRAAGGVACFSGADYTFWLLGFEQLEVAASDPTDTAYLLGHDGAETFTFYAAPAGPAEKTQLAGTAPDGRQTSATVAGFGQVYAYAGSGGQDIAQFHDASDSADRFWAGPDWSAIEGTGFFARAASFDVCEGYLSGGGSGDTATLYDDPASADQLETLPDSAKLVYAGNVNRYSYAEGYRWFKSYATGAVAGVDEAAIHLPAGTNQEVLSSFGNPQVTAKGTGYYVHAKLYGRVEIHADPADGDTATVWDSAGDEQLTADGAAQSNLATIANANFTLELWDLSYVHAIANQGGDDTKNIDNEGLLDFVLETTGTWRDV